MKKSDRTYILAVVFCAATSFFYCCVRWFKIQLPRYYPLQHTWKWVNEKGVPSQAWYAMQCFAFLCAGVVTLVVYFILKSMASGESDLSPKNAKLLGIAGTVVMVFCMSYILYYEFNHWGIL